MYAYKTLQKKKKEKFAVNNEMWHFNDNSKQIGKFFALLFLLFFAWLRKLGEGEDGNFLGALLFDCQFGIVKTSTNPIPTWL